MSVLKNENKTDSKLVGVLMPISANNYITLYSLAKGVTKSKIFKPLIEDWLEQQQNKESDEDLLQEIVQRVDTLWKVRKSNNKKLQFKTFRDELEKELAGKGLKEEQIEFIIKEIE
jgi:hypothetical protein